MTHHRPRHRHVGDLRFAAFMMLIFVMGCCLAFKGEAAPLRHANQVNEGFSECARSVGERHWSESPNVASATERLKRDAILLGAPQLKSPKVALWRPQDNGCRITTGAAILRSQAPSLAKTGSFHPQ